MDALCQLDQLARAVKNMRDLQTKNVISPHWVTHVAVSAAERRVDELVSRVLGGVCAPIPEHLVAQLLDGMILEELLPQLPLPDTKPEIELPPLPDLGDLTPPAGSAT